MGAVEKLATNADLHDEVVLALTQGGREELKHPQAGLSLPQRRLLTLVDGRRSLRDIVAAERTLHAERTSIDAARLLGRGLVELEQGWLQPITRPTTVMPVTAPPAQADARPHGRPVLVAAPAAPRTDTRAVATPRRRGGSIGLALAAGGVVAIAVAYLMQPQEPRVNPVAAPSPQPRAIISVPAAPVAQGSPETAQRPATTLAERSADERAAPARAEAPTAPVQTERATPVSGLPATVARDRAASPPPSEPVNAPSVVATSTLPAAMEKRADSPVAPRPVAVITVPAPANAAAAVGSGQTPATRAATVEAAAPAQADVPAWAREFAPVSPDADGARVVASSGALSPIERIPPIYPREAVRAGITRGSIRALAVLAANGSVERVEFPAVDSANRVFERPARAALMTWTFPPGERGRIYDVVLNFVAP